MDANKSADSELTTAASRAFESVLDQVKVSNLNFYVQLTPFSAVIYLKKTFVKDKTRQILMPARTKISSDETTNLENLALKQVNMKIEAENKMLTIDLTNIQQEIASDKIDLEQMKIDRDISDKNKLKLQNSHRRADLSHIRISSTLVENTNVMNVIIKLHIRAVLTHIRIQPTWV